MFFLSYSLVVEPFPPTTQEWIFQRLGDPSWTTSWELEFTLAPWYTNGPPEQAFLVHEDLVVLLGDGRRFEKLAKVTFDRCAGLEGVVAAAADGIRNSAAKIAIPKPKRPKPKPGELEEVSVCTDGASYEISLPGIVTLYSGDCTLEPFVEPAMNVLEVARACVAANQALQRTREDARR